MDIARCTIFTRRLWTYELNNSKHGGKLWGIDDGGREPSDSSGTFQDSAGAEGGCIMCVYVSLQKLFIQHNQQGRLGVACCWWRELIAYRWMVCVWWWWCMVYVGHGGSGVVVVVKL